MLLHIGMLRALLTKAELLGVPEEISPAVVSAASLFSIGPGMLGVPCVLVAFVLDATGHAACIADKS